MIADTNDERFATTDQHIDFLYLLITIIFVLVVFGDIGARRGHDQLCAHLRREHDTTALRQACR